MIGKVLEESKRKSPLPMPFKCWHKRLQIDSGISMCYVSFKIIAGSSLFGMGEKTMLGLLSLGGRNMAESVPRHIGRSKFHRIFIVSEQFISFLSCLTQYSWVDEIVC